MIDSISYFKSEQLANEVEFAKKESEQTLSRIGSLFCPHTVNHLNSIFNPLSFKKDISQIKSNVYKVLMELEELEANIPLIQKAYDYRESYLESIEFKIVLRISTYRSTYPREVNILRFVSMRVPVDIEANEINEENKYDFEKNIFPGESRIQRPLSHSLAFTDDLYDFLVCEKADLNKLELIFSDNVLEEKSSRIVSHFNRLCKQGVRQ